MLASRAKFINTLHTEFNEAVGLDLFACVSSLEINRLFNQCKLRQTSAKTFSKEFARGYKISRRVKKPSIQYTSKYSRYPKA